ncbi:type I DNA topoisomerase [bacterium]|nr:type I DNA topoisomerase [candidate division CSSED10-310 bacterium]
MKLVIVESPGKIKKLVSFLGRDYQVKASMGHVRDLPVKGLGVEISGQTVQPVFEISRGKNKIVAALKQAVRQAEEVYLAMDPDREGEAIAWHLSQLLGNASWRRVSFHEITRNAVLQAIQQPRDIDRALVSAQLARRILDRLVGYRVSPLLWRSIGGGTSAGRVQSVALRLVVEREREIRAFTPEQYWTLDAILFREPHRLFKASLTALDDQKLERGIATEEAARALREEFGQGEWRVISTSDRDEQSQPYPPFITATLQQTASSLFKMAPTRTMALAQKLYEHGLITYMRTDSPAISEEALAAARAVIGADHPAAYLPDAPRRFKSRGGAQEAHECIRPTDPAAAGASLGQLNRDELRLYELIRNRFLASQMAAAVFRTVSVDIRNGRGLFRAAGRNRRFDGWLKLFPDQENTPKNEPVNDCSVLASLQPGERLNLDHMEMEEHQTKPPPRYTEASLIKKLEKEGIGRPSTYATILKNITTRGYIEVRKRLLHAAPLGETIVDRLLEWFQNSWMEVPFTRGMEADLDAIAGGRLDWRKLILGFNDDLETTLKGIKVRKNASPKKPGTDTDDDGVQTGGRRPGRTRRERPGTTDEAAPPPGAPRCPSCGATLVVRKGPYGAFLACPRFPACRHTQPIQDKDGQDEPAQSTERCPECGGAMRVKKGRKGLFLSCARYPTCKGTRNINRGAGQPRRRSRGRKSST